jgi:hypothetical protein
MTNVPERIYACYDPAFDATYWVGPNKVYLQRHSVGEYIHCDVVKRMVAEERERWIREGYVNGLEDSLKVVSQELSWDDSIFFNVIASQDYRKGFVDSVDAIVGLLEELIDNETNA